MATKRKRTSEPNTDAPATDAVKPTASGRIAPRKRTDLPPKAKGRTGSTPRVADAGGTATGAGADAAASAADASAESARGRSRRGSTAKQRKRRWPLIAIGSVLLVVLLTVGAYSWDRWLRYDDAAEFQGEWQTHGTTAVVVIDGETIKLTEDVSWSYTLDTGAKTIAFTFGNMEGAGRYRFSIDRSQLVITDGEDYSWLSTLTDDIVWQFDQLARAVQGQPQEEPPSGDGYTVLDRLSHDTTAAPQTGTPVEPAPEPDPDPAPEPESAPESEKPSTPEAGTASESETAPKDGSEDAPESPDAGKSDDAGSSDAPSDVFDVSDLPA